MKQNDYIIKEFTKEEIIDELKKYYSEITQIDFNNYKTNIIWHNELIIIFEKRTPRAIHTISLTEFDLKNYLKYYAEAKDLQFDDFLYIINDDKSFAGIRAYLSEKVKTIVKRMR